jgi:phospholipid transport system substrate-binding protein
MSAQIERRQFFRLAAMAGLLAMPAGIARAQSAVAGDGPTAPVAVLNAALLRVMKAGTGTPFTERYAILAPAVDQTFDLPLVLRDSVGLSWSEIPAAQQAALQKAFRRYTIASFLANFDSYDGERIETGGQPRTVMAGEVIVPTRIVPRSGSATRLDYVMKQMPSGWRAIDVLADGSISRVAVQRSDFQSLLASGNGEALIASLQHKVQTLSGGELA